MRHAIQRAAAFLRVDWRHAIGEFSLIVLGVMAALAVGNWNSRRADAVLESEYLDRLQDDVSMDVTAIDELLKGFAEKQASLMRVASVADRSAPTPPAQAELLRDLRESTSYGWVVPPLRRTTYQDMIGTGRLQLIRSPALRTAIMAYYQDQEHHLLRINNRRTRYAAWVYEVVPNGLAPESASTHQGLSAEQADAIVQALRSVEARDLLNAEANYTKFAKSEVDAIRSDATQFLTTLKNSSRN